jgi:PIN domain nuclease of toxin-antitoxin system
LLSQVNIEQVPVDTDLWLESLDLDWGHRDPADRLIVALAKQRDLPILTADNLIREYKIYAKIVCFLSRLQQY